MLETLDYTIRIGSTPTFLYFDLYLYSAYAAQFVSFIIVRVKAVLHSAIFRATCLATAKSALLQLYEQRYVLHLAMFLATCLATYASGD